jgi:tetrapyrrole methylase family protein / MazG family protein
MNPAPTLPGVQKLLDVVQRLRSPEGCPWDREQTLDTLRQYLIEESYEVIDALDSGDPEKHKEELGDVLLQVALHAQIRQEESLFNFDNVASTLAEKLIRRHPHVFGNTEAKDSQAVLKNWESIKAKERKGSVMDGVPKHLPALQKAQRVQSRATRVGFDWTKAEEVLDKVEEEIREIREAMADRNKEHSREEIGDLLFALVNLCRFLDVQAEEALQAAIAKFIKRFRGMEELLSKENREPSSCTLEELESLWQQVKKK